MGRYDYECGKLECMEQWTSDMLLGFQTCPKCQSKYVRQGHRRFIDTHNARAFN